MTGRSPLMAIIPVLCCLTLLVAACRSSGSASVSTTLAPLNGGSGSATSTSVAPSTATLKATWSNGQLIDSDASGLSSISCTSSSFCVAVADLGYEFTYSDRSWSGGQQIDAIESQVGGQSSYGSNNLNADSVRQQHSV
jgi:hypothetical protein